MMYFTTKQNKNYFTTTAYVDNESVCKCVISRDTDKWTISSWYTEKEYQHHGYGKLTLYECLSYMSKHFPKPEHIKYVWNGANQYVFDWLKENFDAVCDCPIAIQKYNSDDDWLSHIYKVVHQKTKKL